MKKIRRFFKRNMQRIAAVFFAVSVSIFSALCPFTFAAAVADYVDYAFDSWDNVPDDLKALGEAYINTLKNLPNNVQSGDFLAYFKNVSDIPKSWVKLLGDTFVLSPVSGVCYFLDTDGSIVREDFKEGGSQGRRRFDSSDDLTVDGDTFKKVYDTTSANFVPAPDIDRLIVSLQNSNDVYKNYMANDYYGKRTFYFPFYAYGDIMPPHKTLFFGQGWSEFYFLPFVDYHNSQVDDIYYYNYYFHLKFKISDDFAHTFLVFECYSFNTGELIKTWEVNIDSYKDNPFLTFMFYDDWAYFKVYSSSSYENALNRSFEQTYQIDYPDIFNFSSYPFSSGSLDSLSTFNSFFSVQHLPNFVTSTDDFGCICQTEPFELFNKKNLIDTTKISDNIAITYGDNLYDYSVTNTDTGDTTTMNEYINNNYVINVDGGSGDDSGSGSGGGSTSGDVSVGGNVTVGGNVDIGGKVDFGGKVEFSPVEIKPIDINVNVNDGSSGGSGDTSGGTSGGGDVSDYIDDSGVDTNIDPYLDKIPAVSKGFTDYLTDFFAWLPKEIYGLLILGLVVAIWCRLAGR